MSDSFLKGIFDTGMSIAISLSDFLLCIGCSLIIGLIMAIAYTYLSRYTKSFIMTLAILPAVVCIVIMMVNGNVGAGVAVAGVFSLVRYRSVSGSAREIIMLLLAMASGLIAGMGYLVFALLFTIIMCTIVIAYNQLDFGIKRNSAIYKILIITIPEDMDYTGVFNDILNEYTTSYELVQVKTTNMGSMFRLTYKLSLKDAEKEREMIDKLRCRNGNLEISISRQDTMPGEL